MARKVSRWPTATLLACLLCPPAAQAESAGVLVGVPEVISGAEPALAARCFTHGHDLSEGMVYAGWALPVPGAAPRDWAKGVRQPEENGPE